MTRNILIFSTLATFCQISCSSGGQKTGEQKQELDIPTRGHIPIMVDEGYRPIIETSIDVFDSIYRQAKIDAQYVPEGQAIKALLDDSIDVIVLARNLSKEESDFFVARSGAPAKVTAIAHDAVAFILHPANRDTLFTVQQIRDILSGKLTNWNQINPKSKLGKVNIVFDHAQSGTVRYAKDSILQGQPVFEGATAVKTNKDVIDYVAKQKNAIGIIGANWVSDTDASGVQEFLKEIRLAEIAKEAGAEGFIPRQGYLATGEYPFKRTVNIVNCQYRAGLGLGFASFLAGQQGQLIVLKAGLLPATAPVRIVKTRRE